MRLKRHPQTEREVLQENANFLDAEALCERDAEHFGSAQTAALLW